MSDLYNTFQTKVVKHPVTSKSIRIVPFGDIHRDSDNCDVDRWRDFLRVCKERDDNNTYYLGMGDYNDFASYSERKVLKHGLHESTSLKFDKWAQKDVDCLAKELDFMKGRLLGLMHGNHEWQFMDGDLATERLCNKLGCSFLGCVCYLVITLKTRCNNAGSKAAVRIFASHGKGGGQLVGSSYNKVEKMRDVFPDADIYLMGHDHKKGAVSSSSLTAVLSKSEITVKQHRQWFGRTGSFLRGWVENLILSAILKTGKT